jgi:hypothetical protein
MADKKESGEAAVRSSADVARAWKAVEAEIAQERKAREKKGWVFVGLSQEGFEKKLKRVESPFITWANWCGTATLSGTLPYNVGVHNPDPVTWMFLAISVSVGNRNAIASHDQFMTTFDARFPTYAKPSPVGFSLPPNASTSQSFGIKIPAGIEKTGYIGNACLLQLDFFDVGKYLDRGAFFFEVV